MKALSQSGASVRRMKSAAAPIATTSMFSQTLRKPPANRPVRQSVLLRFHSEMNSLMLGFGHFAIMSA